MAHPPQRSGALRTRRLGEEPGSSWPPPTTGPAPYCSAGTRRPSVWAGVSGKSGVHVHHRHAGLAVGRRGQQSGQPMRRGGRPRSPLPSSSRPHIPAFLTTTFAVGWSVWLFSSNIPTRRKVTIVVGSGAPAHIYTQYQQSMHYMLPSLHATRGGCVKGHGACKLDT